MQNETRYYSKPLLLVDLTSCKPAVMDRFEGQSKRACSMYIPTRLAPYPSGPGNLRVSVHIAAVELQFVILAWHYDVERVIRVKYG